MSTRPIVQNTLTALACVLAGAVVGVAATIYHTAWFPWGLIVVMVGFAAGLVGLRLLFVSRYPTVVASVSLMVVVATLAGQDSQGSVLVAGSLPGFALLVSASAVASVLLGCPSPSVVFRKHNADMSEY